MLLYKILTSSKILQKIFLSSTHHPASLIIMEIHQVPQLPGLLQLLLVGAVDELPGEVDPVAQVVTEKSVTIMTRPDKTTSYSTVQYTTVQYSTVQYSTVQYTTVHYSTVQYITVQYSTVQYSTV